MTAEAHQAPGLLAFFLMHKTNSCRQRSCSFCSHWACLLQNQIGENAVYKYHLKAWVKGHRVYSEVRGTTYSSSFNPSCISSGSLHPVGVWMWLEIQCQIFLSSFPLLHFSEAKQASFVKDLTGCIVRLHLFPTPAVKSKKHLGQYHLLASHFSLTLNT